MTIPATRSRRNNSAQQFRFAAVLHAAALGLFGGRCNNGIAGPPHGFENLRSHGGRQLLIERAAMGGN